LVDNDDADGIIETGDWKREPIGGYGPSYFLDTTKTTASVKFVPAIQQAGKYQVYIYMPKLAHGSNITSVSLFDGQQTIGKNINKKDVNVVGQTSGEWVSLGTNQLPAGKQAYVQVSNEGADGAVIADAVLFVPVK